MDVLIFILVSIKLRLLVKIVLNKYNFAKFGQNSFILIIILIKM